jgi:hypothetical protein
MNLARWIAILVAVKSMGTGNGGRKVSRPKF